MPSVGKQAEREKKCQKRERAAAEPEQQQTQKQLYNWVTLNRNNERCRKTMCKCQEGIGQSRLSELQRATAHRSELF